MVETDIYAVPGFPGDVSWMVAGNELNQYNFEPIWTNLSRFLHIDTIIAILAQNFWYGERNDY